MPDLRIINPEPEDGRLIRVSKRIGDETVQLIELTPGADWTGTFEDGSDPIITFETDAERTTRQTPPEEETPA